MNREPVRYAIIGCGDIARQEASALARSTGSRLTMVMDARAEYAERFASDWNVPWTDRYEEVLASDKVDAVILATPNHLHAPGTVQAAEAGKHVVVEKPMALTAEEADTMTAACTARGVKLSVAYCYRYWSWNLAARELVQGGAIGEVTQIFSASMSMKPADYWSRGYTKRVSTEWRKDPRQSGGGVFAMNGTHNLDYLYAITGLEAERVYAEYRTVTPDVDVEDTISVVMRYAGGAIGTFVAGAAVPGRALNEDRIVGTEGQIVLGNPLRVYVNADAPAAGMKFEPSERGIETTDPVTLEPGTWTEIRFSETDHWTDPRVTYFDLFSEAVRGNREVPVRPEDGKRAVEVIEAAYRSGKTGRPVRPGATE
jgi:UDP-N-acetyl-2-amino-2-deoxyglucuronate dehydrogenase